MMKRRREWEPGGGASLVFLCLHHHDMSLEDERWSSRSHFKLLSFILCIEFWSWSDSALFSACSLSFPCLWERETVERIYFSRSSSCFSDTRNSGVFRLYFRYLKHSMMLLNPLNDAKCQPVSHIMSSPVSLSQLHYRNIAYIKLILFARQSRWTHLKCQVYFVFVNFFPTLLASLLIKGILSRKEKSRHHACYYKISSWKLLHVRKKVNETEASVFSTVLLPVVHFLIPGNVFLWYKSSPKILRLSISLSRQTLYMYG